MRYDFLEEGISSFKISMASILEKVGIVEILIDLILLEMDEIMPLLLICTRIVLPKTGILFSVC